MQNITLKTDKNQESQIMIGSNIQEAILSTLSQNTPTSIIYICDKNTQDLLKSYLPQIDDSQIITIETGEKSKTIHTVQEIIRSLIGKRIDRKAHIVGFGGGVVTDIVGFVASIYLRGVNFSFIPTTLLGMIDAAVGGKNGVDFEGYKNIVGTINQPANVFVDISCLTSLPEDELTSGMGELIKYAVGFDRELVAKLEDADSTTSELSEDVIARCIKIKANIVESDPLETQGPRKLLNLGHTLAHAIETQSNFSVKHGYAVATGLSFACYASNQLGMFTREEAGRIKSLLEKYSLPTRFDIPASEIVTSLFADKKRDGDTMDFILPKKIGEVVVYPISLGELETLITNFQNS